MDELAYARPRGRHTAEQSQQQLNNRSATSSAASHIRAPPEWSRLAATHIEQSHNKPREAEPAEWYQNCTIHPDSTSTRTCVGIGTWLVVPASEPNALSRVGALDMPVLQEFPTSFMTFRGHCELL
jgi:hypothetical protein